MVHVAVIRVDSAAVRRARRWRTAAITGQVGVFAGFAWLLAVVPPLGGSSSLLDLQSRGVSGLKSTRRRRPLSGAVVPPVLRRTPPAVVTEQGRKQRFDRPLHRGAPPYRALSTQRSPESGQQLEAWQQVSGIRTA